MEHSYFVKRQFRTTGLWVRISQWEQFKSQKAQKHCTKIFLANLIFYYTMLFLRQTLDNFCFLMHISIF